MGRGRAPPLHPDREESVRAGIALADAPIGRRDHGACQRTTSGPVGDALPAAGSSVIRTASGLELKAEPSAIRRARPVASGAAVPIEIQRPPESAQAW